MAKAKSKAKSDADPKKRLKKLLTSIRADDDRRPPEADLVADLAALLDAAPGALAEVDALRLLPHSAEQGLLDVFELLLTRGADPHVRIADDDFPGLGSLICAPGDDARVVALAERMVARGLDINERGGNDETALARAVGHSLPRVDALLRLGVDQAGALAALHVALRHTVRPPGVTPIVERLLAHLNSVDAPGADGLSALHIVALRGSPELLDVTLARSSDPGHRVAARSVFACDGCSPPGGGLIPMLNVPAGFTALDLATELHAMYAAASVWYGDDGFDGKHRLPIRDALATKIARLTERGVAHGVPERGDLPAFVAEVDALLGRLAAHLGGDVEALQRRAAAVPIDGVGPWTYASALLERAGPLLMRGVIEARRGDSWLAHIVAGDHRRFVAARHKQFGHADPDLTPYPPESHRLIKKGLLVGGRGDTLLIVWPHAEGVARVGAFAPGSFVELGDDIFDFLRRELAALGVDVACVPASGGTGPRGRGLYQILKADYEHPPGPADIDRVGGLPIGVDADTWPRHAGAPMHHVLTIDLDEHPSFQPRGVRALALFISSPMEHEAYRPRNDHTRILLLTDVDLKKGEPAWPPELADADTLQPGTLRFESAVTLTQDELYRHSFAGLTPIWLQDDDTEQFGDDEYDEYDDADADADDDDDDDDAADDSADRPAAPVHFVLQFDESLIPGINLGDAGIMYVYAETAWFQCH